MLGLLALATLLPAIAQDPVFRVNSRVVEVYATIWDRNGRYLDGLTQEKFQLRDNGEVQTLAAFESHSASLSLAILLDTTGSMAAALPVVKNSIMKLIDELREGDAVAIYGFSNGLNRLQEFTLDKSAAKQSVLRTRAGGATALFDAVSEVAREVGSRAGKKAIVVFTDGQDNASILNSSNAVQRARKAGVPVYTIAEGDAVKSRSLLNQLKDLSEMTGAGSFQARSTKDIAEVFADITHDLQHTYMLAFRAPPGESGKWRTIELTVVGNPNAKVRAREGYAAE
jgi:VWFA-related protein